VRSLEIDSLRMLADGRIFTGRQARALGLIDTLGGYSQALQYLRTRLGLSEQARIVQKKPQKSLLRDILFENLARHIPAIRTAVRPAGSYFLMELPF
jgi:protease-4